MTLLSLKTLSKKKLLHCNIHMYVLHNTIFFQTSFQNEESHLHTFIVTEDIYHIFIFSKNPQKLSAQSLYCSKQGGQLFEVDFAVCGLHPFDDVAGAGLSVDLEAGGCHPVLDLGYAEEAALVFVRTHEDLLGKDLLLVGHETQEFLKVQEEVVICVSHLHDAVTIFLGGVARQATSMTISVLILEHELQFRAAHFPGVVVIKPFEGSKIIGPLALGDQACGRLRCGGSGGYPGGGWLWLWFWLWFWFAFTFREIIACDDFAQVAISVPDTEQTLVGGDFGIEELRLVHELASFHEFHLQSIDLGILCREG